MRFVIFSKTNWNEPPRLRHQLATLLAAAGHDVLFVQRPRYLWQSGREELSGVGGVALARLDQLIHHRLRLSRLLHGLNARFETRQLRLFSQRMGIQASDVIVNFNYDYYFIREPFAQNRIVSIINDDHWSMPSGQERRHQVWALDRTLRASDACLAVSEPLRRRLSTYRSVGIFRPWSSDEYQAPHRDGPPAELLYWGYINDRLDFKFIERLAVDLGTARPDLRLVFVGPVRCRSSVLLPLRRLKNVTFKPAVPISELDLRHTWAALIPYKHGFAVNASDTPNKFFQLVSRGLPVLITGMPDFFQASFVFRLDAAESTPTQVIERAWTATPELEADMRRCIVDNSAHVRLSQFMEVVANIERQA